MKVTRKLEIKKMKLKRELEKEGKERDEGAIKRLRESIKRNQRITDRVVKAKRRDITRS